jgi:hypothetical protein
MAGGVAMGEGLGREFWERVLREVDGGAKQAAIAARHGLSAAKVSYWVRRLRSEHPRPAGKMTLLPVRVAGEERRRLAVVVGGARLEFEEGTEATYVVAIARALGGC